MADVSGQVKNSGKGMRVMTIAATAMWTLILSDGRQLANIGSEVDARRAAHALGTTQLRGPFSWDVVDADGRRFVAEIRHRGGRGPS
jgi:enhancing lycopene biosynthesis protein 2